MVCASPCVAPAGSHALFGPVYHVDQAHVYPKLVAESKRKIAMLQRASMYAVNVVKYFKSKIPKIEKGMFVVMSRPKLTSIISVR